MKKSTLILLVVIAAIAGFCYMTYNKMVKADESVNTAWADVQSQYQRRFDLIDNLVATVKGYAAHEQQTLNSVIEARSKATQIKVDINDENSLKQFQQAQGELSSALSRLIAVSEAYPDLKANQNFLELQAQLEGTENRIATERRKFNEACRSYNTMIRKFPNSLLAGIGNFEPRAYFEADQAAQSAPKVQF